MPSPAETAPEEGGTAAAAAMALSGPSFAYLDDVHRATTTAPDALLLQE